MLGQVGRPCTGVQVSGTSLKSQLRLASPPAQQGTEPVTAKSAPRVSDLQDPATRIVELGGVVAQGMLDLVDAIEVSMKKASKLVVSAKVLVNAVDTP